MACMGAKVGPYQSHRIDSNLLATPAILNPQVKLAFSMNTAF